MHSFRRNTRRHIGRGALFALIGSTLIALGFVGKSVTLIVGSAAEETAYVHMSVPHELPHRIVDPVTKHPFVIPDHTLRGGDESLDVVTLQNALKAKGFISSTTPTSGHFGVLTELALKKYQISKRLDPTGTLGPLTRTTLQEDLK